MTDRPHQTELAVRTRKRVITDTRRKQGREAQRRYREKLRLSNGSTDKALTSTKRLKSSRDGAKIQEQIVESASFPRRTQIIVQASRSPMTLAVDGCDAIDLVPTIETENVVSWPWRISNTDEDDSSIFDSDSAGIDHHTAIANADLIPFSSSPDDRSIQERDLLELPAPDLHASKNRQDQHAPQIPLDGYLHVPRYSFYSASMANAFAIGISFEVIQQHTCGSNVLASTFYVQRLANSMTSYMSMWSATFSHVPNSLRPVQLQVDVAHDAWLDGIPFASLRTAILMAKLLGTFDEKDFIRDIDSGNALICRGPVPWDEWNWEVSPWFAEKCRYLLGWRR